MYLSARQPGHSYIESQRRLSDCIDAQAGLLFSTLINKNRSFSQFGSDRIGQTVSKLFIICGNKHQEMIRISMYACFQILLIFSLLSCYCLHVNELKLIQYCLH